jgi:hypothetical protein
MSLIVGNQPVRKVEDFNAELKNISGYIEDDVKARILLAKFLKHNIGFSLHWLCGIDLLLVQEIIIRALFQRDVALVVASRGLGKSFLAAVYSIVWSIFNPNSKICIIF